MSNWNSDEARAKRKLDEALDLVRDQIDIKDALIEQQQEKIEALEGEVKQLTSENEELMNDLHDANEALDLALSDM